MNTFFMKYLGSAILSSGFLMVGNVYASEVTGNLNTGSHIVATTTLTGTVTAPTTSTPVVITSGDNGGGGGGGNGGSVNVTTYAKADINKDRKVDILDFVLLMSNWNSSTNGNAADLNLDGKVDILDFVALMAGWTK